MALAQKMLHVGKLSKTQLTGIGRENRRRAARFDLDNIWQKWEKIYATIKK
jgi:glycosyltransferase involved in cell wall biosynthesis